MTFSFKFRTTQLVWSTCQTKSPNVNLHHNSEYADLKYTCDRWKYMYEQFIHNKGRLEIINKLCAIEIQQQQQQYLIHIEKQQIKLAVLISLIINQ